MNETRDFIALVDEADVEGISSLPCPAEWMPSPLVPSEMLEVVAAG